MVKLRGFLQLVDRTEKVVPDKAYRQIGVRVWGRGVYERESILGCNTKYKELSKVCANDIIVNKIWARNGSIAIVTKELDGLYCSSEFPLFVIDEKKARLGWVKWLIKAPWFWKLCAEKSGGTSGKNRITPNKFLEIDVGLPPLEKQTEVFRFLDNSVPSILELGLIHRQLRQYVQDLRRSILQEAILGKLVPQDPNDEPASELMKKIKAQKEKMTRQRRIKKEKELTSVSEEKTTLDKPKGWEWARLNELGYFAGGGTPSTNRPEFWDGNVLWVSPKDMKSDLILDSELKISNEAVIKSAAKIIPEGSILIVARSGILKRMLPVSINAKECTVNQDIKVLVPYIKEINRYVRIMLKGSESFILTHLVKNGMTVQSLEYQKFENQSFLLPPLSEQERIVDKIDELMKLCDELEGRVEENLKDSEILMEAVMKEAFSS